LLDIIIRGGTVYDGTGRGCARVDVGVQGESIACIGDLSEQEAGTIIDASQMTVTPGFIDTHSHSDLRLLHSPPPDTKLLQGVTTEVLGQDGLSVAPITSKDIPLFGRMLAGLLGEHEGDWPWRTTAEYLDALDRHGLPLNVGYLVPHGPIRTRFLGMEDRHAQGCEVEGMKAAIAEAFDQGGVGLSTGLIYPPCSYAGEDELAELCRIPAERGLPFVVHMRNEGMRILDSIDEMIRVARRSGVHLHISHLKVFGKSVWDKTGEVLETLARARHEGVRVTADQYPYSAGCTVLTAVLPTWTLAGGTEALLARLKDPATREELKRWFTMSEESWDNRASIVGWDNVVVTWVKSLANKPVEGKSITEIARMRGESTEDTVLNLLIEENLAVTQITFYGTEETITPFMQDPWVMICTDGIYGGRPHPRLHGSFPRFVGRYVRDAGLLGMAEAVRKMTSLPASTFRLQRRGLIKEGYAADIAVFDQGAVVDNATFEAPENPPTGVMWVLVNGHPVVEHGRYNGKTPGRALSPV
jgi:N-acyl-D-amino-acid deacylase